MCFIVHENYKKALIAEKDIVCYKKVKIRKGMSALKKRQEVTSEKIVMNSAIQHFYYWFNRPYKSPLRKEKSNEDPHGSGYIYQGFHSYISLKKIMTFHTLRSLSGLKSHNKIFVKCLIPKGSKYYINPKKNQYCSNYIKIVKVIIIKDKKTNKFYY